MSDVLERGNVYFLYRPRVEEEEVGDLDDVQRTYMALDPHGGTAMRRIVLGRKRLPDIRDGGGKTWGFVDEVSRSGRRMGEGLGEETYETKTRGERHLPAARPAAEGVYAIVRHDDHTHLAYALELPEEPGDVQRDLQIDAEGSFILSVKNPDKPSPSYAGLQSGQKADYPKRLQERFEGRRFIPADPPDLLDHEGAELLLVGADEDVEEELGIRLRPQDEDEEHAEILRRLRLSKKEHPREPLLRGEWR